LSAFDAKRFRALKQTGSRTVCSRRNVRNFRIYKFEKSLSSRRKTKGAERLWEALRPLHFFPYSLTVLTSIVYCYACIPQIAAAKFRFRT
jgi:hypothetical protein